MRSLHQEKKCLLICKMKCSKLYLHEESAYLKACITLRSAQCYSKSRNDFSGHNNVDNYAVFFFFFFFFDAKLLRIAP